MAIRKRFRQYKRSTALSVNNWKDSLPGVPVFLVGNAPSLCSQPVQKLQPFFTIGINKTYKLIDPNILLWQDIQFWLTDRYNIARTECIKYCRNHADPKGKFYNFTLEGGPFKMPNSPDLLYGGGASGPLAFQLAYLLGCSPIFLVGMDCKYDLSGKTNFYGKNKFHSPHTLKNCNRGVRWIEKMSQEHNIKVINCSDNNHFSDSKMELKDAIDYVEKNFPRHTREEYSKMLWSK